MKKTFLYAFWFLLLLVCAGLGFLPQPAGAARWALRFLSMGCFVPPVWLLVLGERKTVRYLSAASLGLTLLLLVLNIRYAAAGEAVGAVLNGLLTVVSSPMIAGGYWALSLFAWACLFFGSFKR